MGLIREGKVRALGVTTKGRSVALKDIPAINEFYQATKKPIIAVPESELASILNEPLVIMRFEAFGAAPTPL
jgi:tripartite-type tricarboxylate transporter receptor subunit TctC